MIKVVKDFDSPTAILLKNSCLEHIKKAIEEKNGSIYSCNNYRHDEVLKELKEIYHDKCSYCESKSEHVAPLQVAEKFACPLFPSGRNLGKPLVVVGNWHRLFL